MKSQLKLKYKKKKTPVIINPPIKKKDGENTDVYVESTHAIKHAVPPTKTAHAAKRKKKKTKDAKKPYKGALKGTSKKKKFYVVTVKTKDKSALPKAQTLNVRAKSEVDAYALAKRYYTNAKSNKVRLDKKRNKIAKLQSESVITESLLKKLAIGAHNFIFNKSPLTKKIESSKRQEAVRKINSRPNNRDEEYDVHDSTGTHIGTHKNYQDAANHANDHKGHIIVRKTHVTKYHVVHDTGGGRVGVATYKTGKKGSEKTHTHTYDSIHKARSAIEKHGLDPAKHRIAAIRTKIQ